MRENVRRFELDVRLFEQLTRERLQQVTQGVGFVLGENVVIGGAFGNPTGTPVDTGFARAQWTPSLHDPIYEPAPEDQGGIAPLQQLALTVAALALGDTLWFVNGASYIRPLENGHSRQAPLGMIAPVLANAQALVDHVVQMVRAGDDATEGP